MAEASNITVKVDAVITDEMYHKAMGDVRAANERMDQLEEENAKLREERDIYRDLVGLMDNPDINVQLQAENAELRKLVDELYPLADNGASDVSELDKAHELMRELGIEVDV